MKETIEIIAVACLFALVFLFAADTKIQLKPFSVSFGDLSYSIGLALVCLGLWVLLVSNGVSNYRKGFEDGCGTGKCVSVDPKECVIDQKTNNSEK